MATTALFDDQYVEALASEQVKLFEHHPDELVSRINEERAILDSYRGRQILELIQTESFSASSRWLLRTENSITSSRSKLMNALIVVGETFARFRIPLHAMRCQGRSKTRAHVRK